MSSWSEKIEELLQNRIRQQPQNFEQRWLLDVQHPCKFRQKFQLSIETFEHLLEAVGPQLEHRTWRKRALMVREQLLVFLHFLGTNSFYHVMHLCHGISTSMVWNVIDRITPAILSLRHKLICWPKQPLRITPKFHDIAGFPCVAGCVDGTHVLVNPPAGDEDA
ncbi:putative nuclease HARBI1 [Montipora capricornis]|uniref:putative nuclease HARBI1 n=1 Tax=Montipora capricornis TaxID=246305 RepID=UPI0035F15951